MNNLENCEAFEESIINFNSNNNCFIIFFPIVFFMCLFYMIKIIMTVFTHSIHFLELVASFGILLFIE